MANICTAETIAETCEDAAIQRIELLQRHGAKSVLELCVGPSLPVLRKEAKLRNMTCTGNDIDPRWDVDIIGDCLKVNWGSPDAVVFAPPLSIGCSGRREDSLRVSQVFPRYEAFLGEWAKRKKPAMALLVLPARSMATGRDRNELHKLIAEAWNYGEVGITAAVAGKRQIRKYVYLLIKHI